MSCRLLSRGFRLNQLIGAQRHTENIRASAGVLSFANLDINKNDIFHVTKRHGRSDPAKKIVMHKDIIDKYRQAEVDKAEELRKASEVESVSKDMPEMCMSNPYSKPQKKCIICQHNVPLDYKNTRLLTQFVSPYTGRMYGRHITGLCLFMQKRVGTMIKTARFFGLMPYMMKEPKYLKDHQLFDPLAKKS